MRFLIYINITSGIVVYPKVIESRVMKELPFMASENIMMEAVKRGGDRQELHEIIRAHSMEAGRRVKEEGLENDLVERLAADKRIGMTREEIYARLDPKEYIGRCPAQVEEFIREYIDPVLTSNAAQEGAEIRI